MNYEKLFTHLNQEHGLLLLESEMQEIVNIVIEMDEQADYWMKAWNEANTLINCLKSGFLYTGDGALRISEIESYFKAEDGDGFVLNMKSGEKVSLSNDFNFIHDLFSTGDDL